MEKKRISMTKPTWAINFLKGRNLHPDTSMDEFQKLWWGWYTADNAYYKQPYTLNDSSQSYDRMSLKPASMLAGEIPSLVMNEGTVISSSDNAVNEWIERTIPDFADEQADFLSNVFALGTGAWIANYEGVEGAVRTSISAVNAWQVIPVDGGIAIPSKVIAAGREYDQLQIRILNPKTDTQTIETLIFDAKGNHRRALEIEGITPFIDTKQTLPTYAIVRPSKFNSHDELTRLGVSIIEDVCDTCRLIDESFNQLYWQVRVSLPKVFADEQAVKRDVKTGKALFSETLNQLMYIPLSSGINQAPITVYNPDTHINEMVAAINNAFGLLGQRAGFGAGYWSFTLAQGLKTATEVVSANSMLMRTIRRHEHAIENSIRDLIQGAYSAECALNGYPVQDMIPVDVLWDDSIISDDKADRDLMKDDIQVGLCPKWRYLVKYQGMSEEDARKFTGEMEDKALPQELGE